VQGRNVVRSLSLEQSLQYLALGVMVMETETEEGWLEVNWRPGLLEHPTIVARVRVRVRARVRAKAKVEEEEEVEKEGGAMAEAGQTCCQRKGS